MVKIGGFLGLIRIRLNIETYSPLKPTNVGYIFIGPNFVSRAEYLAAVNQVTQAVVKVGSKIEALNLGLRNYDLSRNL